MSSLSRILFIFSILALSYKGYSAPMPAKKQNTEPVCYTFKEKGWQLYSNRKRPKLPVIRDKQEMLLTRDNLFQTGVAAAISNTVKPPFEVTFSYSTWDDDGSDWSIWNSADGFSFFFLKDASDYGTPPDGNTLGLKPERGGYAVRFKLYGYRSITLTGEDDRVLDWDYFRQVYTHRRWIPVRITVSEDRIQVHANNQPLIDYQAEIYADYSDLGFTASTGGADAEIMVKDLCVKPLKTEAEET